MSFDLRKLLEGVTHTNTFRLALDLAMQKVGVAITEHAHDPETVKRIGGALISDGSKVADAVLHGTEAEQVVDKPVRPPQPKSIPQSTAPPKKPA